MRFINQDGRLIIVEQKSSNKTLGHLARNMQPLVKPAGALVVLAMLTEFFLHGGLPFLSLQVANMLDALHLTHHVQEAFKVLGQSGSL